MVRVLFRGGPVDGLYGNLESLGACWVEEDGVMYEYWIDATAKVPTVTYNGSEYEN